MKVKLLAYTPNPEKHIEYCGRVCYNSQDKITEDSYKKFIERLIKNGHTSVLEHASATFEINDISRVLTHQLVRHRHLSFSMRSLRYTKEFDFIIPDSIKENKTLNEDNTNLDNYLLIMEKINYLYNSLLNKGIRKEDARFILPSATKTSIIVSGNFRAWREVLELRLSKKAQWEIRRMSELIRDQLIDISPSVFGDLK